MTKTHSPPAAQWRKPPSVPTSRSNDSDDPRDALARAEAWFSKRETRAALVARRLLGRPRPSDPEAASFLIREIRRRTRMDGSIEGSLVRTAWAAGELLDVGAMADEAPVVRTVGFVLSLQDQPGHYGEGCEPDRHVSRRCTHFLKGFFSPGSRDVRIAPLALPSGITVEDEEPARFAASCLALRVVLRAGEHRRPAVQRHVESLLGLESLWGERAPWPLDLVLLALNALLAGPYEYRTDIDRCLSVVLRRQATDGSWPGGDLMHAVDVLTASGTQGAREALERTLPHMLTLQRNDGHFEGGPATEERTLIAVKALRFVLS